MEEYGKMIFLSEESKEKFANMSDAQIDQISRILARDMNRIYHGLNKQWNENADNANTI